jgi:hypothetical protein
MAAFIQLQKAPSFALSAADEHLEQSTCAQVIPAAQREIVKVLANIVLSRQQELSYGR